jgi:RimJ/RimL family protein N-acetyltransferase
MTGPVFLHGESTDLRTIEEEDLEFLRNGVNHPGVRIYMGNRAPQNLDNQEEFFEEVICGEDVHLMICDKNEESKGIVSLKHQGDRPDRMGELGLWVHPEFHGHGHGSEASKMIIKYAFEQLNYHRLYARAYESNRPSQKIWERLGFEKEGTLRDHTYSEGEYKNVIYYGMIEGENQ